MNIVVVGTNTWNKGAQLMQVAIGQHFAEVSGHQLYVPDEYGSFLERCDQNLGVLLNPRLPSRQAFGLSLLGKSYRLRHGLAFESEVDTILDASGFAFGDQHPVKRTINFAKDVKRWKKQGKAVILLPQALGSFEKPLLRDAFSEIIALVDRVYAREKQSFDYANSLGVYSEKLKMAPDFTCLVKPLATSELRSLDRVCIVPNQRMIEKVIGESVADDYLSFLVNACSASESIGLEPVLLTHGVHDEPLVEKVSSALKGNLSVITTCCPVTIKAEIGRSKMVIGSRFHALVSALTQSVPVVATSWSHKYEMLMAEYGLSELLLDSTVTQESLSAVLQHIINNYDGLVSKISVKASKVEQQAQAMWREVDELISDRSCLGQS